MRTTTKQTNDRQFRQFLTIQVILWQDVKKTSSKLSDKVEVRHVSSVLREDSQVEAIFEQLEGVGARSDLLKYQVPIKFATRLKFFLQIVFKFGGIYLDTDTVSIQPLGNRLKQSFVAYRLSPYFNIQSSIFGFAKVLRKHFEISNVFFRVLDSSSLSWRQLSSILLLLISKSCRFPSSLAPLSSLQHLYVYLGADDENDKMSKENRSFAPGSVPRSIGEDGESGLPGSADEQVDTLSGDHHQHQHQRLPERVWTNMPILFQATNINMHSKGTLG